MLSFLLNPEWAIPLATMIGFGIAKLYNLYKKTNTVNIDKFTAIGTVETNLREGLMDRLTETEARLDKLLENTQAINLQVSSQNEKIKYLEQQLKNYKKTNRDLTTQLIKIRDFIESHNCDDGGDDCDQIKDIIRIKAV